MSRYSDRDDYEGETEQILALGRWENNARRALKSKRGRQALRDLRDALLTLPDKRLIEGAVCTVGADKRREAWVAAATKNWEALKPEWRPDAPWADEANNLDEVVRRNGEGVCAVGAYIWHSKVKAGADPAEAFASLPDVTDEGSDGLEDTAGLGQQAGMAYTLAWELAYRNDETYSRMTPEGRYTAFLAWIDSELTEPATT
jgi:hypothetical protein